MESFCFKSENVADVERKRLSRTLLRVFVTIAVGSSILMTIIPLRDMTFLEYSYVLIVSCFLFLYWGAIIHSQKKNIPFCLMYDAPTEQFTYIGKDKKIAFKAADIEKWSSVEYKSRAGVITSTEDTFVLKTGEEICFSSDYNERLHYFLRLNIAELHLPDPVFR